MSLPIPGDSAGTSVPTRTMRPDFRLEGRRVSPRLNRVITPAVTLQVEPKIMQTLVCLADSAGEVVTRERLFREVWQGAYVTEDALTRAIGELRRIFEDDSATPRVIETIRKTGYRLLVIPEPIERAEPAAPLGTTPPAARQSQRRWIAVGIFATCVLIAAATASRRILRPPRSFAPTRVRTLTALPGNTRDPAVSPDGTRVAFAWNGGAGDGYSLYVQLVDGEAPLRVTAETGAEDRLPAWSPDGQRLAFTRMSGEDCQILLVSALGGPQRALQPCGDREYRRLAWSPDGNWIAFVHGDGSAPRRIDLVSPETLTRRTLTSPPAGIVGDSSPAFSPDGAIVAFARNLTDGVSDVYRVSIDGAGLKRLTFDDRDTMGLDWSADGTAIVFSSSRAGIYSLWRVSSGGGDPAWVAGGGAKMKHPSTSRARRVIAYENWIYAVNLWRVPTQEGPAAPAPLRLTDAGDEWNFAPALSPAGDRIAFVSTRSGAQEIWTCDAGGENLRKLTSFNGARLENPRWSPEGKRIVFSARREARSDLYSIEAAGAVPERLTDGTYDAVAPDWSRDGRAVYFGSRRDGSWQIWKLELALRRLVRVTRDGGYAAHESPDGRWLYVSRADASGVWRLPANGGSAARIPAELAPEDWANWQIGARGIYFRELCARHRGPALALWTFGTPASVDVAPLPDQGWSGFAVLPDGGSIVYPRVDRHACDIRLIEDVL